MVSTTTRLSAGFIALGVILAIIVVIIIVCIAIKLLAKNKSQNSQLERVCPQCGKPVGTDKKFCVNCGAEVKY